MKETSELLRSTRKEKNLTIEEISSQTKIQLHILRSLESGEVSDFRGIVFVKGFLKQYAKALDLDPEEILKMFEQEHSGNRNSPKSAPVAKLDDNEIRNKTNVLWFRTSSKFLTAGGILVVFALVTAIYFFSVKLISYSQETVAESPVENDDLAAAGDDAAAVSSENTPQNTADTEKTAEAADTPSTPPAPEPKKPEVKTEESLSLPAPTASETKNSEATASTKTITKPKMVTVDAFENVVINAVWSTGKKETVKLKNNGKHTFYYAEKLKLEIDNGGGVGLTTHTKEIGVPGELGQPMTVDFD